MNDFLESMFVIAVMYFTACGIIIPIVFMASWSSERNCAEIHQVYECEFVYEWVPVKGEQK